MNHTPGEWIVSKLKNPSGDDNVYVETDNELVICEVGGFVIGPEEALANARLIAASPALLEACKETSVQLSYLIEEFGEDDQEDLGYIIMRLDTTIRLATEETK